MEPTNSNEFIDEYSRSSYQQFLINRDVRLCRIVETYGITKASQLTGWTKPTVITAVKKYRPELLKRNKVLKTEEAAE